MYSKNVFFISYINPSIFYFINTMTTTLTEVFWVTFITVLSGMVIKLASMCYKSKCQEVTFCCLKIVRDVASEEKEEEFRISHNKQDGVSPSSASLSPSSPRSLNEI